MDIQAHQLARLNRRNLLRFAARGTLSLSIGGVLSACAAGSTAKPAGQAAPPTATTAPAAPNPTPAGQPSAVVAAQPSIQAAPGGPAKKVSIEYWQYFFEPKQDLVNELIPEFQKHNPNIEIVHRSSVPYAQFQQQLAAAAPAGQGPDVVNLYYGWLGKYTQAGYVVPLPETAFPPGALEKDFFPVVQGAKLQGKYWGVPTAVRTLALFWNKDLYARAGLNPAAPPTTWDEFVDHALKSTTRDTNGTLQSAGFAWGPTGQLHHWWRECLNRQNGLLPMSADLKKVAWSDPKGIEAFTWFTDLATRHKVGEPGFYTDDQTAFKTGHAALHIDGSFRLGTFKQDTPDLNYGVAPLPTRLQKASYASFWVNCLTKRASGERQDAAIKWLQFLTTPDVMRRWTDKTGELPASPAVAREDRFTRDARLGPFIQSLDYGYATFFVDETADRQAVLDAIDEVLLNNVAPGDAVKGAEQKIQTLLDDYWASVK